MRGFFYFKGMDEYEIKFYCQDFKNDEQFYARRVFCGRSLIDACELAELDMSEAFEIYGETFKAEIVDAKLIEPHTSKDNPIDEDNN
jgi:hypothetical protein